MTGSGPGNPGPWPLPIRLDLGPFPAGARAEASERSLRARPGVAVFVGEASDNADQRGCAHTISVSACGDLRAFVTGRLRGDGPRADMSEVTTLVEACEAGSGFEADLACDAVARARTPEAGAMAAARRGHFFVHLDPDADAPACRVMDGGALGQGLPARTLVGPFAARSHAESWAAMLDGAHELCRKPTLLAQRPEARACEYKDMGLCPAPCDGSEPMEAYRDRARGALRFDGAALEARRAEFAAEIADASASMDFERAATLKEETGALESARSPGIAWITTMDRFAVLAVMPSGKKGWARVFLHARGRTETLADVDASVKGIGEVVAGMVRDAIARLARGGSNWLLDADGADAVAAGAQHARSGRRTRGRLMLIDGGDRSSREAGGGMALDGGIDPADLDMASLGRAIRKAANSAASAAVPESPDPGEAVDSSGGSPSGAADEKTETPDGSI